MPKVDVKEVILAIDWDKEFTKSNITLENILDTNLPSKYAKQAINEIKKKDNRSIKDILLKALEKRDEENEKRRANRKVEVKTTTGTKEPVKKRGVEKFINESEKKGQTKSGIKRRKPLRKEPDPILIDKGANVLDNEEITALYQSVRDYQNKNYGSIDVTKGPVPEDYGIYSSGLELMQSTWRRLTGDQRDVLVSTYGECSNLDSTDDFIQDTIVYEEPTSGSKVKIVPNVLVYYDVDGGNENLLRRAFIFDVKRALEANYSLDEIEKIINREKNVLNKYYTFQKVMNGIPEDKISYGSTYKWFNKFFDKQTILIKQWKEVEELRDKYYRETNKGERESLLEQIKEVQGSFDKTYESMDPVYHKIDVSKFDKRNDPIYIFKETDEVKYKKPPKSNITQERIKELVFGKNLDSLTGIKSFRDYKSDNEEPYYNLDWLHSSDIIDIANKTFNYLSGDLKLTAGAKENWPVFINEVINDSVISYLPLVGGNVINGTKLGKTEKQTLLRDLSVIRDDLFNSTNVEQQIIDIAKVFYYINRIISQEDNPSKETQLDLIKHPSDIDWFKFVSNQDRYKEVLKKENKDLNEDEEILFDESVDLINGNTKTTSLILALADTADFLTPFFDDVEPMEIDDEYINLPVVMPEIDNFRVVPAPISQIITYPDGTSKRIYKFTFNKSGDPQFRYDSKSSVYKPGYKWNMAGVQRLIKTLQKASEAASYDEYLDDLKDINEDINLNDIVSDLEEDESSSSSVFVDPDEETEETETTMQTTKTDMANTVVSNIDESAIPLASRLAPITNSTLTLTALGNADQTKEPSTNKVSSTGTEGENQTGETSKTSFYSSVHTYSDPSSDPAIAASKYRQLDKNLNLQINELSKYKENYENLTLRINEFFHAITAALNIDPKIITEMGASEDHLTNLQNTLIEGYRTVNNTIRELQNQVLTSNNEKQVVLSAVGQLQQDRYFLEKSFLQVTGELENTRQNAHNAIVKVETEKDEIANSYNTVVLYAQDLRNALNSNSIRSNDEKEALLNQIERLKEESAYYLDLVRSRTAELGAAEAKIKELQEAANTKNVELERPDGLKGISAQTSPRQDDSPRLEAARQSLLTERARVTRLNERLTTLIKENESANKKLEEQRALKLESIRKHAEDKTALETEIEKLTNDNEKLRKSIDDFLSVVPSSHRSTDLGLSWLRDLASNHSEYDTRDNTMRPGPDSNTRTFNLTQQLNSRRSGVENRIAPVQDFLTLADLAKDHMDLVNAISKDNTYMSNRFSSLGILPDGSQMNQTVKNSGAEQLVQRIMTPANVEQFNEAYRSGTGVQMNLTSSFVRELVGTVGPDDERWFKNRESILQTRDLNGSSVKSVRFQGVSPLSSNGSDFDILRRSSHVRQSSSLSNNDTGSVVNLRPIGESTVRLGPVLNEFNREIANAQNREEERTDVGSSFIPETRVVHYRTIGDEWPEAPIETQSFISNGSINADVYEWATGRRIERDTSGNGQPRNDRDPAPSDNGHTSGGQPSGNSGYASGGSSGASLGGGGPGGSGPSDGGSSSMNLDGLTSSSSSSIQPAYRSQYNLREDIGPYLGQSAPKGGILKENDMDNVTKILTKAAKDIEQIKRAFVGQSNKNYDTMKSLYLRQLRTRLSGLKEIDMDRLRRINQTEQRYNEFLLRQEQAHQQHVYNTMDMKHKMSMERLRGSQARLTDRHRAVLSRRQDIFKSDLSFSDRIRDDDYSDYRVGIQNTERITNRAFLNSKISDLIGKLAGQVDPTLASFGQELVINHLKGLVSLTDEDLRGVETDGIIKMIDDGTVDRLINVMAAKNQNNVNDSLSKRMSDLENTVRSVINIATQRTAHVGHLQAYSPPRRVFVRRDGKAYQGNRSVRVGRTRRLPPRTKQGRFKKASTRRVKK